jgi:SNF2 family DNA or RNA helicase
VTFTGTLLPYQVEAVEAMVERKQMLVAYDLGLGKTVLTIAAIESLKDSGSIREPGVIVCLSSLKYQWADQIRKFTDGSATPLVIDGTPKQRAEQYQQALDWGHSLVDYVIINYEQVVNDWESVRQLATGFIVCDEATAVKSFRSKRSKYVKKLQSPVKFALTGTPVENGKPEELYSIMQFVDPKVLGRFDLFDSTFIIRNKFGGVERYRNLPLLNKTLLNACVRKKQSDPDVAPFLPETIHSEPIYVPFDRAGRKLYTHIVRDLLLNLEEALDTFGTSFNIFSHYGQQSDQGGQMDELRGLIMSKMTCLRLLCDDPQLLALSANKFEDGAVVVDGNTINIPGFHGGSGYASELKTLGLLDGLKSSPKLAVLKQYVDDFLSQYDGNKIVIFSSFVGMTKLIQEALPYDSVTYTGQLNAKQKEEAKEKFQTDPNCRLFISSDAGGYGVDLPQANLLINYDLPWNAGLAVQRNGRIKRASSTWEKIVIQDILMENSLEQRQREMLIQKTAISDAVLDGQGINDRGGVNLSVGTLRAFLQVNS